MHAEARIVALGPHDGTTVADAVEGRVTFKARALETGGALTIFERDLAPGDAVAEHLHPRQDEALYVLDGELGVRIGAHSYTAAAGAFLLIPRGTPHRIENRGDAPARILAVLTPASQGT